MSGWAAPSDLRCAPDTGAAHQCHSPAAGAQFGLCHGCRPPGDPTAWTTGRGAAAVWRRGRRLKHPGAGPTASAGHRTGHGACASTEELRFGLFFGGLTHPSGSGRRRRFLEPVRADPATSFSRNSRHSIGPFHSGTHRRPSGASCSAASCRAQRPGGPAGSAWRFPVRGQPRRRTPRQFAVLADSHRLPPAAMMRSPWGGFNIIVPGSARQRRQDAQRVGAWNSMALPATARSALRAGEVSQCNDTSPANTWHHFGRGMRARAACCISRQAPWCGRNGNQPSKAEAAHARQARCRGPAAPPRWRSCRATGRGRTAGRPRRHASQPASGDNNAEPPASRQRLAALLAPARLNSGSPGVDVQRRARARQQGNHQRQTAGVDASGARRGVAQLRHCTASLMPGAAAKFFSSSAAATRGVSTRERVLPASSSSPRAAPAHTGRPRRGTDPSASGHNTRCARRLPGSAASPRQWLTLSERRRRAAGFPVAMPSGFGEQGLDAGGAGQERGGIGSRLSGAGRLAGAIFSPRGTGDGAPRRLDALLVQHLAELAVRQRLAGPRRPTNCLIQRAPRCWRRCRRIGAQRRAEEVLQLEGARGVAMYLAVVTREMVDSCRFPARRRSRAAPAASSRSRRA